MSAPDRGQVDCIPAESARLTCTIIERHGYEESSGIAEDLLQQQIWHNLMPSFFETLCSDGEECAHFRTGMVEEGRPTLRYDDAWQTRAVPWGTRVFFTSDEVMTPSWGKNGAHLTPV